MENVEIDVNSGASSAPAPEAAEPQTDQVVEQVENQTETATVSEQPVVPETIPLERLKQIEQERDYWRQKTEALFEKVVKGEPQQPAPNKADPYAGMDAETKVAWMALDERTRRLVQEEAEKLASVKLEPIMRQTKILMEHFSTRQLQEFRAENPDIASGSQEEAEIISYLNAGMPKDKAVWAVMGPKRQAAKQAIVTQTNKAKIEKKAAANLETEAVPKQNGLPEKKLSFEEELRQRMQESGF